ncbi:hypothetical protein Tco_0860400 [Tanacetum coccineum]|uniref:Uncharacterized protein n=1 Tax=Tanacetum coccineum TaxID=301880 RepID=A0ABQ5BFN7_9ASTR
MRVCGSCTTSKLWLFERFDGVEPPVDVPYCKDVHFYEKEFMGRLYTNCVENDFFKDFHDTSESSDDNTNVVNAPREPIVVDQDPGENSSPNPPHTLPCVVTMRDDDSYENIDYVDASPPDDEIVSLEVVEIVDPEVGRIDDDILLTIKDNILREKLLKIHLPIAKIDALRKKPNSIFRSYEQVYLHIS